MDWSLLIGFPVGLAMVGAGAYGCYRLVRQTKNQFYAHQPALRITNLSALNAGDVLTQFRLIRWARRDGFIGGGDG